MKSVLFPPGDNTCLQREAERVVVAAGDRASKVGTVETSCLLESTSPETDRYVSSRPHLASRRVVSPRPIVELRASSIHSNNVETSRGTMSAVEPQKKTDKSTSRGDHV
ncbi:hypothetical protein EYF80_053555 [Liparis tanakae]|uniref:Uncharacterized protein n=1 Tax=Liparis tanakae TaxID=230148 RepID=A0A4Z2F7H2_9TELE|nr:hypothetical protein EYF80_053555 [Liparis tanakae]